MRKILISIAFALMPVAPALSSNHTGNFWLQMCDSQEKNANPSACMGFLIGALNGFDFGQDIGWISAGVATNDDKILNKKLSPLYCMPAGVINKQVQAIFVSHLKRHPERLHQGAAILLIDALVQTYPCR